MDAPIDRLPDSLLLHILSFLDVKTAAITSVLSKRWRFLWADSPRLEFRERERRGEFVAWVNRILNVHRTSKFLDKFELYMRYNRDFASDVNAWIEFCMNNKAKHVDLMFFWPLMGKDRFILPQMMYSSSSLTCLKVKMCIMSPERAIDWGCLTKLHLERVQLSEELFSKILSGCPVLHHLILSSCCGFDHFEVHSRSLYELEVINWPRRDKQHMEISAPYLRSLKVTTDKMLRLTNIPSLVSVYISLPWLRIYHNQSMFYAEDLFESIKHVKKLELGCCYATRLSEGLQLAHSTREHLTVNVSDDDHQDISLIVHLLNSSPNLETLVIKRETPRHSKPPWFGQRRRSYLKTSDLNCDLLHLKTVDLRGFTDSYIVGESMLTLVQILLKRAVILEKLSIEGTIKDAPVAQTVLSYPRSSEKASVVLVLDFFDFFYPFGG